MHYTRNDINNIIMMPVNTHNFFNNTYEMNTKYDIKHRKGVIYHTMLQNNQFTKHMRYRNNLI